MAVTASTRFGLTRWSAGTDPFSRAQLDADHAKLDSLTAQYGQGTLAGRSAPGTSGRFYYATDGAASTTLTYDTGVAWVSHPHAIGDLPVAASGAVSNSQLVRADDARLSDARTPLTHSHAIADLPVAASGTSNTTQLVRADDARLSNARTPTAHVHSGADITSGTVGITYLPVAASGSVSATQLVRADDSRLSDARTPTAHVHAAADVTSGTFGIARIPTSGDGVSSATLVPLANDSRLSNARTPTAHSHAIADLPVAASGVSNTTQLVRADDARLSDARTPAAHSHLIGDLPVAASGSSSATQLVRADDSRLSDARTPTAHVHAAGDITSGTMATARLGTGTADATTYLRGDNTWAAVAAGSAPSITPVVAASLASQQVSSPLTGVGQVIDGYTIAAGDVVLLKDQVFTYENGVWIAAAGAWSRHPDFNTAAKCAAGVVRVLRGGTLYGAMFKTLDFPSTATLGTTPMYWAPLAVGTQGGRETTVDSGSNAGSKTIDCLVASVFTYDSPTTTLTFTLSNPAPTGYTTTITVRTTMGATARSVVWPGSVVWLTGTPTYASNKTTLHTLMTSNGGTTWYGSAVTQL